MLLDLGAEALSIVCRRRRRCNRTQTLPSPASLVVAFFDDDAGERVEMGRQPVRAFMSSKKAGEPTPAKCRDARGALSAHTPAMHPAR